jgi:iron complex transport system substrate-binding protein
MASPPHPRIVSLLASATEIVAALGLEESLVGISHECDYPAHVLDRPRLSRPRFDPEGLTSTEIDVAVRHAMAEHGSVYAIDDAQLAQLDPDLVLTQAVCEVCAVPTPGVREAVAARDLHATVVSLDAHTIHEILDTILVVGRATGEAERAHALVDDLKRRMATVTSAVQHRPRPRVLAIEWLGPPFVPGHWVPEQIERAGGVCLAGETGSHSHQVDWKDLKGFDPDVLILMPCGYGLEASRAEADRAAEQLLELAPRAIEEESAFVVDGSSYFNRSGPRVVDGVEILAGLLHAEVFERALSGAADKWKTDTLKDR